MLTWTAIIARTESLNAGAWQPASPVRGGHDPRPATAEITSAG
jgi:hypothetical protein